MPEADIGLGAKLILFQRFLEETIRPKLYGQAQGRASTAGAIATPVAYDSRGRCLHSMGAPSYREVYVDAQIRPEAEQVLAKVQEWVKEGESRLKELSEKGEPSLADTQAFIEKVWAEFETEVATWVEIANSQRATFEAQAKAQLESWQGMVDECLKRASEVHESGKAQAEAEIVRLKDEAKKAEAQIDELRKAGEASWSVMSKGLEKSRSAFATAARQTWSEFSKTASK